MRINRKYQSLVMGLCMATGMSFFMSLFMTLVNAGLHEKFLGMWIRSWGLGLIVAIPTSLILPKFIAKLVDRIMENEDEVQKMEERHEL